MEKDIIKRLEIELFGDNMKKNPLQEISRLTSAINPDESLTAEQTASTLQLFFSEYLTIVARRSPDPLALSLTRESGNPVFLKMTRDEFDQLKILLKEDTFKLSVNENEIFADATTIYLDFGKDSNTKNFLTKTPKPLLKAITHLKIKIYKNEDFEIFKSTKELKSVKSLDLEMIYDKDSIKPKAPSKSEALKLNQNNLQQIIEGIDFQNLEELILENSQFQEDDILSLVNCSLAKRERIKTLNLNSAILSHENIIQLFNKSPFPNLETLSLGNTLITHKTIQELEKLPANQPNLRALDLGFECGPQGNDDLPINDLINLEQFKNLEELIVWGNNISRKQFKKFMANKRINKLTSLDLGNIQLNSQNYKLLYTNENLQNLKNLAFGCMLINTNFIRKFCENSKLNNLESLQIIIEDEEDPNIEEINALFNQTNFPNLTQLEINNRYVKSQETATWQNEYNSSSP